jgi:hypothetical protein
MHKFGAESGWGYWQYCRVFNKGAGMKSGIGKALSALVIAAIVGVTLQTNTASAGMQVSPDVTELGLKMRENAELGRMPSMFYAIPNTSDNKSWRLCKDIDDKPCTEWSQIGAIANLAPCLPESQLSCIAGIWAVDASGKRIDGEFVKNAGVDPRYKFDEIPSVDFPRSDGMGSIWRIPGVKNSGGTDTYFAGTQLTGNAQKTAGTSARAANFGYSNLIAGIMPTEEISAQVTVRTATDGAINPGGAFGVGGTDVLQDGTVCAATEVGKCFAVRQFPEGYKFGLMLRLTTKQSGWFHGRFYLPSLTFNDWKSGQEISIEAEPVKVPSLEFSVPNAEIPQAIRSMVFNGQEWGMSGDGKSRTLLDEYLGGQRAMDLVSGFAPAYKDKATKTTSYWSFRTLIQQGDMNNVYSCSAKNSAVSGLVTTNALSYSAGPPSFDKATSSLNYKVASPHYEADGTTVALGTYDLALRSEVARCIYGFSKAPIQAVISITSQDGEQKVATTTINERNGWLYLSAKGFTFSSPTINVKLSQEASPEPTPSATPSASATKAAAKKIVKITCTKSGKKTVVSGVKPVCPKGYKLVK